jgi:hypothetical protein
MAEAEQEPDPFKLDAYHRRRWKEIENMLRQRFGQRLRMEVILFLVGRNEVVNTQQSFHKEEKQDLMHVGLCSILAQGGYYQYQGLDADGWPHYELIKPLPNLDLFSQLNFLRYYAVEYFDAQALKPDRAE